MRLLWDLYSLAVTFVVSMGAGLWLFFQVVAPKLKERSPAGWIWIAGIAAVAAVTAYSVTYAPHTDDCRPAGPGIYNDC